MDSGRNFGTADVVQVVMLRDFAVRAFFPFLMAVVNTARHAAILAYLYWSASVNERNFHPVQFIEQDLRRPFFEPYEFCAAWTSYNPLQYLLFGFDFPAYVFGYFLHRDSWTASRHREEK